MPTVYSVTILNHLVDSYEEAQRKVIGAERWLDEGRKAERLAWANLERLDVGLGGTGEKIPQRVHAKIRETMSARSHAESDLNILKEREQQAMRTLCDAVLLAAKGS